MSIKIFCGLRNQRKYQKERDWLIDDLIALNKHCGHYYTILCWYEKIAVETKKNFSRQFLVKNRFDVFLIQKRAPTALKCKILIFKVMT